MVGTRLTRWLAYSQRAGTVAWLVLLALSLAGGVALPQLNLLLLLAVLVVAPLALRLVAPPARDGARQRLYAGAVTLQPLAALPASIALLLPTGTPALLLVLPWLLFVLITAGFGVVWLAHTWRVVEERVIGFGLVYVAIGGFWLLFSRAGMSLLTFDEPIITLTAIHFHYISLGALICTGMTGRVLRARSSASSLYRIAAAGVILGPPLVAAGITYSVTLEAVGTILLALSLSLVALLILVRVVPAGGMTGASALLGVSALSVLLAMVFAAAYALGRATGAWHIAIPTMIEVHGWLNAVGFALPGLAGWTLAPPGAHAPVTR